MHNHAAEPQLPAPVLSAWHHTSDTASRMLVLPDGCRDFIIRSNPSGTSLHMVSPLDDTARYVESDGGDTYYGWRLHPGTCFKTAQGKSPVAEDFLKDLVTRFQADPVHGTTQVLNVLDELFCIDTQIVDALNSLKTQQSVLHAARDLGVSERSLQRWLTEKTGRSPIYWRSLARARQSAQALLTRKNTNSRINFAELAADFSYADQAHLCREFQRWFSCSPSAMLCSATYQELILADGYA